MFFFFKWLIIFLGFTLLIYCGSVFISLPAKDLANIKHAVNTTIASDDNKNLITALKEPLNKDWQHKKAFIIDKLSKLFNLHKYPHQIDNIK